MILKDSEAFADDIDRLEALLADPRANARIKREIEDAIRRLRAGERGEKGAAYHLKSFFGATRNWVVLNDLRLEHDGLVAQIDHLLIGRMLDIWVCESKYVGGAVKINELREFTTVQRGFPPRAMASPLEQNERHVRLLKSVFDSGAIRLPTRLGFTLQPRFRSLVLISNGSIIRPKGGFPGLETVIKSENLKAHVTEADDRGNPFDIAKLVGTSTIEDIGRQLLALHRPIVFDWERRLKMAEPSESAVAQRLVELETAPSSPRAPTAPTPPPPSALVAPAAAAPARKAAATCATCANGVSYGVKAYCLKYPERFGGQILCMTCQATVPTPS